MKRLLFALLIVLLPAAAFAGTPGHLPLIGKIVDDNSSEGLAGVEIRIKETGKVVYSDFEGNFVISDLPEDGSCTLEIHYLTYNQAETVALPTADDLKIRIAQRP